jgi:RNA polymerase sigma factor (sigma-70 family)
MQQVDSLTVSVVVDNTTDMLSTRPPHVNSELRVLFAAGMRELAGEGLCSAHHGLSLLIIARANGQERTVLFDAGPDPYAIERNARRMGLEFGRIEAVVLSQEGLVKAVERFDPGKGGKLSTYSAWWIKQSIKRALANQSKTIRLPVHLVDKIAKVRRVGMKIAEELGREPTDEELAEEIGISSAKLSQLKRVSIRPASLDAPISDDDSTQFGEIVGDEEAQTPFELLRDKNLRDEVSELLEVLDDREREIIFQRFGLDGGNPKTLEVVGKKFGVTRERIRQLQNIALDKLRRALRKRETQQAAPVIATGAPFHLPQAKAA